MTLLDTLDTLDTPLGYLHAKIMDGGIGIPCLQSQIPLLQRARFIKILNNASEVAQMIRHQKSFRVLQNSINTPIRVGPFTILTKAEARAAWRDCLFESTDGKELKAAPLDKSSHDWLKRPNKIFPRLHLRGIQL